ncbi:MAG TPA: heme ABC exporter ATP-binding protein CcmA [Devosia sp.]|nr:heme ABC exporter ATP-binding protein CcmA [Devosia sp.]
MSNNISPGKIHLHARDMSCRRGDRTIFSGVGFQVSGGEALMVRGANGSGKSSLLMCLAGILPAGGDISWTRGDSNLPESDRLEMLHFIGHLNAIKNELTLAENLQFWSAMSGGEHSRITDALEQANLAGLGTYKAGHLSAGQRHRLSLARLLVTPRPIWLLDEPSSALDRQGDRWVAALIARHMNSGGLAIVATHLPIALDMNAKMRTLELENV